MITTSEDYMKMLQDIQNNNKTSIGALVNTGNESRFVIDANERNISIPPEFQKFIAVQHDHNAETIFFEIDRYFDGVDLSTKTCIIQFINAGKEEGIYPVLMFDLETLPGKIIFEWKIQNNVTSFVGVIYFAVRFYSIEKENFTYNLNTKIYTATVLDGLDGQSELEDEKADIVQTLLCRFKTLESNIDTGNISFNGIQSISVNGENIPQNANKNIDITIPKNISDLENDRQYQTEEEVSQSITQKISELIAEAPKNLDTLKEIADWITEHEDDASAMNSAIIDIRNTKADKDEIPTISEKEGNIIEKKEDGFYARSEYITTESSPVGEIIAFMGTIAPEHYLACDGTVYNIGDYKELERHFEKNFGMVNFFGGDGVTTFAVPDLRGEFLRMTGENSHANQGNGADVGKHQDATIHVNVTTDGNGSLINYGRALYSGNHDYSVNGTELNFRSAPTHSSSSYISKYTSRPTNTSVLYCIKYEPTYETNLFDNLTEEQVENLKKTLGL